MSVNTPPLGPPRVTAEEMASFLATLRAIEKANALLDARLPSEEEIDRRVGEAVRLGGASAVVLTRASALLSEADPEEAHALLERAVRLDAAPAPTQLALSRSFRTRGNIAEASRWLRGAMLRARPDAALLLELAVVEIDHAAAIVDAARDFPCRDASTAEKAAIALVALGRRQEALVACDLAFQAGARGSDFLACYSEILDAPDGRGAPSSPASPLGMPRWWIVGTHAAQASLARTYPAPPLVARAQSREASDRWIGGDRIRDYLSKRIADCDPFSWVRLGDGEARFLLHLNAELRTAIPAREAEAMAKQIWYVWFGEDIGAVPQESIAAVGARLTEAIRNANLLGVTSSHRLTSDTAHYGFCAALEAYLDQLLDDRSGTMFTDALMPLALNERDPFLGSLLWGMDFVGVISPHASLADRLQRHLSIARVESYCLPGEQRLSSLGSRDNADPHFPTTYDRILSSLTVPHRGAVFLVAGGLLGKIYCERIRELGGIALDIGALADAWMGHNTRGTVLDQAMRQQLPV